MYVADAKGFFREQGIEIETTRFQSAADMTGPLGANQIDVGGVAQGVALINAIQRGVNIRIVADKGNVAPGHGFEAMLLRKDLHDSGAVKGPADLKGRKWAFASLTGTTPEVLFNSYMQQAGLHARDADVQAIAFPDMISAFANKAIDGASVIEPFVTQIVSKGDAEILMREDTLAPNHQIAVVMYSPGFPKDHPDLAVKFMMAYIKGVRFYNDAFGGKAPDKRGEVIDLMVKNTSVKDRALYDKMVLPGLNPDGEVNLASLKQDQDYDLSIGLQKEPADMDKVVDLSFVREAVKQLGPANQRK